MCWMERHPLEGFRCRWLGRFWREGRTALRCRSFTLHPLAMRWPHVPISYVGHNSYSSEGLNLSQHEPCLQKRFDFSTFLESPWSYRVARNTARAPPGSPVVTMGPMCMQSPSPAPEAPHPASPAIKWGKWTSDPQLLREMEGMKAKRVQIY